MLGASNLLLRGAARALRAVKTDGGARASEPDSGPTATNPPQDERSITTMRTTRMLMLSLLAVFAFSAITAAASATVTPGGPVWIHKTTKTYLAPGEKLVTKSKQNSGTSGVFKLKTSLLVIQCTTETDTGELIGGNPGTDTSEVTFEGCSVEKKSVAECGAASGATAGKIGPFKLKTLLGYPKGKAEKTDEAYDQFFATPSETEFTSFTLTGTKCGALNEDKTKVVATGTKAKVVENEKNKPLCGVIARVGMIKEPEGKEEFVKTVSEEVATAGGLQFPEPAIKEEEVWNGTAFEVVKCGLEAKITNSKGELVGNVPAEEVGVALVETVPAEPFGWEI
jgi:hypothetical protein